jgi:hypothetical protein
VVLDLRTVERALARQLGPGHAAGTQAGAQRFFGLVPDLVGADAVVRTQRQLDVDIVEAEVRIHFHRLRVESHHFRLDLLFGAEDVAIILGEAAHAHDAVQRARRLVAVALAELAVAQRQVAVERMPLLKICMWPGQFIGFSAYERFSDSVTNMFSR